MNTREHLQNIVEYLPAQVRRSIGLLPEESRSRIQEIRLRAGKPVCLTSAGKPELLAPDGRTTRNPAAALIPSPEDIAHSFQAVMSYSVHSHQQDLAEGFVTIRGGCRVGLCGSAVRQGDAIQTVKSISALNFRIPGEFFGCAASVFRQTGQAGGLLIAGAPASGKTTFLRDLCRLLGDRFRTALVDERGEIAAVYRGIPQHDVGLMTDVLDGYPRAEGILTALRVMNPDHILCDELSRPEDVEAVRSALGCGVQISASVHAGSFTQLQSRRLLQPLLEAGAFRYCVMLTGVGQVQSVRKLS
ncbi:MAG: Flp pilus assembly complex ATPase component TadA [Oscillospiraceae bacterium]|nr:Flp pilus assembly complex ATPase component TadA [Oscillospiraceae bacterium]